MAVTLASDVNGTLIDTHGVGGTRGETFAGCTRDALDCACSRFAMEMTPGEKQALLDIYRELPAFDDVHDALTALSARDCRSYAFSNGSEDAVETLLSTAGIRDLFHGVVSCDDLRTFKPNPAVYAYFLTRAQASASEAWLISGNPFDVIGAISAGMHGAWVQRSAEAIFDPWGIEPTVTVKSLDELADSIGV